MISIQSNCLLVITLCFLAGNVVFSQISFCFSTENGFVMVFLENLCNFYDFMFPDCVFCIISVILIMCFYVQSSLWLPYCNKMCVCVCVCVICILPATKAKCSFGNQYLLIPFQFMAMQTQVYVDSVTSCPYINRIASVYFTSKAQVYYQRKRHYIF